jgi:hypothetical protein
MHGQHKLCLVMCSCIRVEDLRSTPFPHHPPKQVRERCTDNTSCVVAHSDVFRLRSTPLPHLPQHPPRQVSERCTDNMSHVSARSHVFRLRSTPLPHLLQHPPSQASERCVMKWWRLSRIQVEPRHLYFTVPLGKSVNVAGPTRVHVECLTFSRYK